MLHIMDVHPSIHPPNLIFLLWVARLLEPIPAATPVYYIMDHGYSQVIPLIIFHFLLFRTSYLELSLKTAQN